ncbi:MAG: hypothetical protein IIC53_06725 [Proteobacteria bacterium]|nr:hypothetical protein [Pseudomonadota bacterium]MCH8999332.1 hypothetical protein [Pseudomonadota bacterium]
MTRIFVICAALLGLSACGGGVGLAMLAASTATFIHTDKTTVDLAVSYATDRDCSILYLANDENYCKPAVPIEPGQVAYMSQALYCYRTLGGVNCYDRPDYTASSQTRIIFGDTLIAPLASAPMAALQESALE